MTMGHAMAIRQLVLCLLLAGLLPGQIVKHNPQSPVQVEELGLIVPMHDGVHLAADLFLPQRTGRWPTVLVRTPYNRKAPTMVPYRYFVRRGYAVVIEDVRGRFASQGNFGPLTQEGPDGNDTINWIAEQPWSNGRVAMVGSSYLGIAEWWAAIQGNPHLRAISPVCSGDDEYLDRFYSTGGALKLGHRLLWIAENFTPPSHVRPLLGSYIFHLPVRSADVTATSTALPLWRDALDHPSYDSYWKGLSVKERFRGVELPVLSMGGWFDNYAQSDLDAFSRLSKQDKRIETWIGPWGHNPGLRFPTVDFGDISALPIRSMQADWFDRWLKNPPANSHSEADESTLHIFVMGQNAWREEHEWPLARTRYTPLYLNSKGHANSAAGDGTLQWQTVKKAQADNFTYDPKNPVPTIGGSICCEPAVLPPGPLNQTPVEGRQDVLIYTTPPLTEEMEFTGPVRVVLYVSTSGNDTDFTAKLVDVQPNGIPLLVTDGIQRLRYRLSLDQPVFVKKNNIYQISIDSGVTSYVFEPGHRIRLEVSSSNFPRFDRSLNSFRANADETKITKAHQVVFHQQGYPSAMILPLIPKSSAPKRPESRRPTAGSVAHDRHVG